MRYLILICALAQITSAQSSPADAGSLRGKRITNPLQPLDKQGLGWDAAAQKYIPLSYSTQSGSGNYCAPAGASTTAYTCNLTPAISAYTTGMLVAFKPDVTNIGASTVAMNSLAVKSIQKLSSGSLVAVASGDLVAGVIYILRYNGTVFIVDPSSGGGGLVDPGSNGLVVRTALNVTTARTMSAGTGIVATNGDGVAGNPQNAVDTAVMLSLAAAQANTFRYCLSATGNATATCTLTPSLTAYTAGGCFIFQNNFTNTTTYTVNIDGNGSKSIFGRAGGALAAGEITTGVPSTICYDGTQFIIQGGGNRTIAAGTAAMGTSAISSATCATAVTVSATGVLTTDVIQAAFNGDPTAVTGYVPLTTGMLVIIPYPTADNVNFKVCNNTSSSLTPGAITLNWRVSR